MGSEGTGVTNMTKDISPEEEEVEVGIGRHEHDDEPSYRCTSTFAQRHKKKFMISIAAISFIAVVLSTRSYSNDIDKDDNGNRQTVKAYYTESRKQVDESLHQLSRLDCALGVCSKRIQALQKR